MKLIEKIGSFIEKKRQLVEMTWKFHRSDLHLLSVIES